MMNRKPPAYLPISCSYSVCLHNDRSCMKWTVSLGHTSFCCGWSWWRRFRASCGPLPWRPGRRHQSPVAQEFRIDTTGGLQAPTAAAVAFQHNKEWLKSRGVNGYPGSDCLAISRAVKLRTWKRGRSVFQLGHCTAWPVQNFLPVQNLDGYLGSLLKLGSPT